jgi:peroxidase
MYMLNYHTCANITCGFYVLGDLRVNEQPPLGAMHTLFLREHNRVARKLTKLNAEWKDERLFQESRRVVNAQFQHIVYNEFLPILIGKKSLIKFGLSPLTKGFSRYYK